MFSVQILSPIQVINPPKGLSRNKTKKFNRQLMNKLRSYPPYQKLIAGNKEIESYRNDERQLHRIGGPALIVTDKKKGTKSETWYENGMISRPEDEGPAKINKYPDGSSKILYYKDGALHRYGGPAKIITDKNGDITEYYYVNGELDSMGKKRGKVNRNSTPAISITKNGSPVVQEWYNKGLRDRINAPAVITNNKEEWWTKGKLNRVDGPARSIINEDGSSTIEYYRNNLRHRNDGPAYIRKSANGDVKQKWYSNGKLHRIDGPAVDVIRDGIHIMEFYEQGKLISDKPARVIECESGLKLEYYENNKLSKTDCTGECFCE